MLARVQDTSFSYLIESRKLLAKQRKDGREDDRVRQGRGDAGLTRGEDTTRAGGERQKHTGAEGKEQSGCHEKIGLGENQTESLGDERVHEEENETVERDRHLSGLTVHELDVATRCGEKDTGAERQKKSGGDGNLLGCKFGQHCCLV